MKRITNAAFSLQNLMQQAHRPYMGRANFAHPKSHGAAVARDVAEKEIAMNPRRFSAWTVAFCLACAAALPAQARGPGHDGGDCRQEQPSQAQQQRMTQRMEQRQAALKTQLKLSAEQEPAWQAFVQAMKPADMTRARPNPAEFDAMTTPQRMEKMKALRAEREAHMNQRMQAVHTFYSALTPEQQKVFDAQKSMRPHHSKGEHRMQG
jgi:periplasmic protein CpxP/Spy